MGLVASAVPGTGAAASSVSARAGMAGMGLQVPSLLALQRIQPKLQYLKTVKFTVLTIDLTIPKP